MSRLIWLASLVAAGCTQPGTGPLLPTDAGLPADIHTLATSPLQAPPPPTVEDIAGAAFVPTAAQTTWTAMALPMDTPALTQTLWVRQITRALPDLSEDGVTLTVADTAGLVVWTLNGPQDSRASALATLLNAIASPQLTDDGLAGALTTRPHSSDPADPVTLRTLHEQTAVTRRLWLSADSTGRERVGTSTETWKAGVPVSDGDEWLSARARGYTALASCKINKLGGSSPENIRRIANGIVMRRARGARAAVPLAAEAWRAGQPDFIEAIQQRIEVTDLPEHPAARDCAFE